ncbi:MAG: ribosomal protein S18-alanine N-acetyltransferase [Leptolyngbyaceae cyanobacterium]
MRVICRPVVSQDLPNVVTLDHRCFGGLWSEAAYTREMGSPNSDLWVLEVTATARSPRRLSGIGCIWAILEEAHITLLGIEPADQGQGLGQWLLIELLRAAIARGLSRATLEVRPSNSRALALYKKYGFGVAGERRRYYADGESALILWKSGLQTPSFAAALQRQQDHLHQKHRLTSHSLPG